jgi:putative oxidoreductase
MKKILLRCLRIWLGAIMIYNGRFIFTYAPDTFWYNYFRTTIHFPFPDLMFYLAKGAEFFGGLFLLFGLMTRISAAFIAFTMLIATLFANMQNIYGGFGSISFSYFLFSIIFILEKPGEWSVDHWLLKKRNEIRPISKNKSDRIFILYTCLRIWFGSLLVIDCYHSVIKNKTALFFNWIFQQENIEFNNKLYWIILIAEIIFGLFIMFRSFSKIFSRTVALIMLLLIIFSILKHTDFESYYFVMTVILFWFGCIFSVDEIYKNFSREDAK